MSTDEGMKHVFVMAAVEESPYWDAATEEAAEARWDSWLAAHDAQVRRDAAREALDGLIADTAIDVRLGTEGNDPQRVQDAEAVIDAAQVYRDTEYPEETP